MAERDFKGVWFPKDIWLDKNLTMLEKGILVEIDNLDMSDDGCWASNEYLAEFCQCSVTKVANAVSKLVDLGYVKRESFDGRRRKLKSCLSFFARQTFKNCKADVQKVNAINTSINTTIKDTPRKSAKSVFTDGFDDFWAAYPKTDAKQRALEAWSKLKPNEELRAKIMADIRRRKAGDWRDIEPKYIPYGATYLNKRYFDDYKPEQDPQPDPAPYQLGFKNDEEKARYDEMIRREQIEMGLIPEDMK